MNITIYYALGTAAQRNDVQPGRHRVIIFNADAPVAPIDQRFVRYYDECLPVQTAIATAVEDFLATRTTT